MTATAGLALPTSRGLSPADAVGTGLRREEYGTHSLRRTNDHIKATGILRAVQIVFGHTKIENTVCYLGMGIDDSPTLAENTVS